MSVKYSPRKFRSFRLHKQPAVGHRLDHRLKVGQQGVFAADYGQLNWRIIETGRRFLARQYRRSKVWIRYTLTQPLTAKSSKARMGGGKGKFRGWTGYIRPGTLMYEMRSPVPNFLAEHKTFHTRATGILPLERLKQKFPFALKIVRGEEKFGGWSNYGLLKRKPRSTLRRRHREPRAPFIIHRPIANHNPNDVNWLGFFYKVWRSHRSWFSSNSRSRASRLNWISLQKQQQFQIRERRRPWLNSRLSRLRHCLLPGHFYSFTLMVQWFIRRSYPRGNFIWNRRQIYRQSQRHCRYLRNTRRNPQRWGIGLERRLLFLERMWKERRRHLTYNRWRWERYYLARHGWRLHRYWLRRLLRGRVGRKRKKRKGDFWIAESLIIRVRLLRYRSRSFRSRSVLWLGNSLIPLFRWHKWRRLWLMQRRRCGYYGQWNTSFKAFPPIRKTLKLRRYTRARFPGWFQRKRRRVLLRFKARHKRYLQIFPKKRLFRLRLHTK